MAILIKTEQKNVISKINFGSDNFFLKKILCGCKNNYICSLNP
jgi:hypothetical protein